MREPNCFSFFGVTHRLWILFACLFVYIYYEYHSAAETNKSYSVAGFIFSHTFLHKYNYLILWSSSGVTIRISVTGVQAMRRVSKTNRVAGEIQY